jgi:hypothetical protein
MPRFAQRAASALASTGGQALKVVTGSVGALRPAAKPLHPRGELVEGVVRRFGLEVTTGVPWIDEAGQDDVLVRLSRAVGLPEPFPDVHGLALRIPTVNGAHADLLFASTGWGRVGRFLLTAGFSAHSRPMTTLLPYRTAAGSLLLGLVPQEGGRYDLACATATGHWSTFGELVTVARVPDALLSFDPVRNRLPGLEPYDWVVRLREPAYHRARGSRAEEGR